MDAATGGTSGGAGGGACSDCEGEDQEDSSSSNSQELADARTALVNLNLQEESKSKEEEDALAYFRQQWQRELVSTPSPQRQLSAVKENPDKQEVEPLPDNDEDKAKALFLRGVALERGGKLYEAVQHYKRAVQLLPDVEQQLYDSSERGADTPEVVPEAAEDPPALEAPPSDEDDQLDSDVDLVARLQRILARKGRLCDAEFAQRGGHISWLPYEVLLLILRWVVGSHLDAASLERASMTCRGLYLAAREQDIWRTLCIRTWGIDCGTPKAHGFPSWRDMYIDRSRLNLHGVYISKTTYLRHGENTYQDQFYKPWYLIEYYRYLRFFPEGLVLSWTTADEPASCVAHLKHRQTKNLQGIMSGHYRLIGDKVVIVLKKAGNEKKPAQTSNTRFRARRKDAMHDQQEQIFHLELQLHSTKCRRNWQLLWRGYSVCTRRDQWTSFELQPNKYPPFYFSQVRNYTNETEAPLI